MSPYATRRSRTLRPSPRGFTLIELMITVAVIAILARIAIPSYLNYTLRAKLTEAFNQLTADGLQAGQYYQDNRNYTNLSITPSTANFNYAIQTSNSGANYTITATGSTSATTGFTFTLTDAGARQTTAAPTGWQTSTLCWINSQAGTCY